MSRNFYALAATGLGFLAAIQGATGHHEAALRAIGYALVWAVLAVAYAPRGGGG